MPEALAALREQEQALAARDVDAGVRLEVARAGESGLDRAALQARSAWPPRAVDAALARLSAARTLVRYDKDRGAFIAAPALQSLKQRALAAVAAHHAAQPLADGLPREELRGTLTGDVKLLHATLESLAAEGALVVERDIVRQPAHNPSQRRVEAGRAPLAERALALWTTAALQPPRPPEAAVTLGVAPAELTPVLELLVRGGSLVRIKDLLFHRPAVDELRARLVAHLQAHGQIDAQGWKELVGASRKFSIPLAEHFDAEKVTLRVGELRRLRTLPRADDQKR